MKKKSKALKIVAIGLAFIVGLAMMVLMAIGLISPETYVYTGDKLPQRWVKKCRDLGLLEEGEKVEYLYSDAFIKLEEGVYILTDQHLVLYSTFWEIPKTILDYDDITSILVTYDDSFLEDSSLWVATADTEDYLYFPVSSEKKRDRDFVAALEKHTGLVAEERDIP